MQIEVNRRIWNALHSDAGGFEAIRIAMADDHTMLRQGLANLIESFGNYKIVLQAGNGKELTDQLAAAASLPDLVLLDISMPEMDGYKTAAYLQKHYPAIKILALSMMDDENAIIRMIKNGARGYVLKDADPSELRSALSNVLSKGYHYSELVTGKLIFSINKKGLEESDHYGNLSTKELDFLKQVCTELTYKEIAEQLNVSPRTVDGYRDVLFEKLGVKTRVGLVMYAVKKGIVKVL